MKISESIVTLGCPEFKEPIQDRSASIRRHLECRDVEAIEVLQPSLCYVPLIPLLCSLKPFHRNLGTEGQLSNLSALLEELTHTAQYDESTYYLFRLLENLLSLTSSLVDKGQVTLGVRNWFTPGDATWHVDRSPRKVAYRVLWCVGRREGLKVTPRANIDLQCHDTFMRREDALLTKLDRDVIRTGLDVNALWSHRPQQVFEMASENFPFIRSKDLIHTFAPTSVSIHKLQTTEQLGTYHRASWANRIRPGLQFIFTVVDN